MSDSEQDESSKAEIIKTFIKDNPKASSSDVVEHAKGLGVDVKPSYVRHVKSKAGLGKKGAKPKPKASSKKASGRPKASPKFPRHSLERSLRIPRGILDQNAGRDCTDRESATFIGVKYNRGPFVTELSSCIKFGLLDRPKSGHLTLTDLARQILRPQRPDDELQGLRKAILTAPEISDVYEHYRGENLPDDTFLSNAITDKFGIPESHLADFKSVFFDSLKTAQLIDEKGEKLRLVDVSGADDTNPTKSADRLKAISKNVKVSHEDSCFVMMPFAAPLGAYYSVVYKPAIEKAGLTPVRADDDIFSTGKIIDQIWRGINSARVLVAELTSRNANVFYELGLAHALQKPVVLVSSNEGDVPFDLHHIRVIYYDVNDPFWGQKLIDKLAENIISALKNPEETLFKSALSQD